MNRHYYMGAEPNFRAQDATNGERKKRRSCDESETATAKTWRQYRVSVGIEERLVRSWDDYLDKVWEGFEVRDKVVTPTNCNSLATMESGNETKEVNQSDCGVACAATPGVIHSAVAYTDLQYDDEMLPFVNTIVDGVVEWPDVWQDSKDGRVFRGMDAEETKARFDYRLIAEAGNMSCHAREDCDRSRNNTNVMNECDSYGKGERHDKWKEGTNSESRRMQIRLIRDTNALVTQVNSIVDGGDGDKPEDEPSPAVVNPIQKIRNELQSVRDDYGAIQKQLYDAHDANATKTVIMDRLERSKKVAARITTLEQELENALKDQGQGGSSVNEKVNDATAGNEVPQDVYDGLARMMHAQFEEHSKIMEKNMKEALQTQSENYEARLEAQRRQYAGDNYRSDDTHTHANREDALIDRELERPGVDIDKNRRRALREEKRDDEQDDLEDTASEREFRLRIMRGRERSPQRPVARDAKPICEQKGQNRAVLMPSRFSIIPEVQPYNPQNGNWDEFVHHFRLKYGESWNDCEVMSVVLKGLLRGEAFREYRSLPKQYRLGEVSIDETLDELQSRLQYDVFQAKRNALKELNSLSLKAGETVAELCMRIDSLYEKAHPLEYEEHKNVSKAQYLCDALILYEGYTKLFKIMEKCNRKDVWRKVQAEAREQEIWERTKIRLAEEHKAAARVNNDSEGRWPRALSRNGPQFQDQGHRNDGHKWIGRQNDRPSNDSQFDRSAERFAPRGGGDVRGAQTSAAAPPVTQQSPAHQQALPRPKLVCHYCGNEGHTIYSCPNKGKEQPFRPKPNVNNVPVESDVANVNNISKEVRRFGKGKSNEHCLIFCFGCGTHGHSESCCPDKVFWTVEEEEETVNAVDEKMELPGNEINLIDAPLDHQSPLFRGQLCRKKMSVYGVICNAVLDSGACSTIIPDRLFDQIVRELGQRIKIHSAAGHNLKAANGQDLDIKGMVVIEMVNEYGETKKVGAYIMEKGSLFLLGQNAIHILNLRDHAMTTQQQPGNVNVMCQQRKQGEEVEVYGMMGRKYTVKCTLPNQNNVVGGVFGVEDMIADN